MVTSCPLLESHTHASSTHLHCTDGDTLAQFHNVKSECEQGKLHVYIIIVHVQA